MIILHPDQVLLPTGFQAGQAVAIEDDHVVAVGPVTELETTYPYARVDHLPARALMPGLVDTHHHLTETFAKAATFGEPAQLWRRVWYPLECGLSLDDVYRAAKHACLEALRGGFTTVVETGCKNPDSTPGVIQAVAETGIRCVLSRAASDVVNFEPVPGTDVPTEPLDLAIKNLTRHIEDVAGRPRITPSVSLSSVQTCSPQLFAQATELCRAAGAVLQVHANEHTAEIDRCLDLYRRRPIELLAARGALGPHILIAHAVLTTPTERRLLAEADAAVSYCPVASIWKGCAMAPALDYLADGIRLGLGTDATRSDGFRLMEAAETAQRISRAAPVDDMLAGGPRTWLHAATRGGAQAAGLDTVGTIAPGFKADLITIALDKPELAPSWNLEWELVRLVNRSHVRDVYVDGQLVLHDGQPTTWDPTDLLHYVRRHGRRVAEETGIVRLGGDE